MSDRRCVHTRARVYVQSIFDLGGNVTGSSPSLSLFGEEMQRKACSLVRNVSRTLRGKCKDRCADSIGKIDKISALVRR